MGLTPQENTRFNFISAKPVTQRSPDEVKELAGLTAKKSGSSSKLTSQEQARLQELEAIPVNDRSAAEVQELKTLTTKQDS